MVNEGNIQGKSFISKSRDRSTSYSRSPDSPRSKRSGNLSIWRAGRKQKEDCRISPQRTGAWSMQRNVSSRNTSSARISPCAPRWPTNFHCSIYHTLNWNTVFYASRERALHAPLPISSNTILSFLLQVILSHRLDDLLDRNYSSLTPCGSF